jgi:hypothetical protein
MYDRELKQLHFGRRLLGIGLGSSFREADRQVRCKTKRRLFRADSDLAGKFERVTRPAFGHKTYGAIRLLCIHTRISG